MQDEQKSWFKYYRGLLAGREEEDLSFSEIQSLVKTAKAQDVRAQRDAEYAALEEAQRKFYKPTILPIHTEGRCSHENEVTVARSSTHIRGG